MRRIGKVVAGFMAFGVLSSAALATETITYTYDARGRLIRVVHTDPTTPSLNNNQACYTYDKADNRTNVKVDVGPASPPACPP